MTPAPVDIAAARAALIQLSQTLPALLRAVGDPHRHAVGRWDIAETATHLTHAWAVIPALSRGDLEGARAGFPGWVGGPDGALMTGMLDLDPLTVAAVGADPERDLGKLAARIEARATEIAASFSADPHADPRPWMFEGMLVPQTHFACHLLNESVVHGLDIAKAAGIRWPVEAVHAALVLRGFLLPMTEYLSRPLGFPPGDPGSGRVVEIRLRGGAGRSRIHLGEHEICVDGPCDQPIDSHLSVTPLAMLELVWARRTLPALVASGKLTVWGRRPWTALALQKRATPAGVQAGLERKGQ